METRVEKRKRMKAERLRRAARFLMVFISAAVLISAWAALTTAGGSAGTLDTTPPKMLAIASDEPVAEAVRLTLHVDHKSEEPMWSQAEVEAISKTVYGEAMVTGSDEEMSAVVWCILNRVDSQIYPDSIIGVITQYKQFHGYHEDNPVDAGIETLVLDVLGRWEAEKQGQENVGRTLPTEYLFFWGDGWHNHFTTKFQGGDEWDWSLPNPYDT